MSYITAADIKVELEQLAGTTEYDDLLDEYAADASHLVNTLAGLTTDATAAASSAQTVYGSGTLVLDLPPHVGAVTLVSAPTGHTVPDYVEVDGNLVITDTDGTILQTYRSGLAHVWGTTLAWTYGLPYTVTAPWGYSARDLAVLRRAALRIAVHLWLTRDGEGENVDPAASALTPELRDALAAISRVRSTSVGVF